MKKSIIAAAFAAVLPFSAMAKTDLSFPEEFPEGACHDMGGNNKFCAILRVGARLVLREDQPPETEKIVRGFLIKGDGSISQCFAFVYERAGMGEIMGEIIECESRPDLTFAPAP